MTDAQTEARAIEAFAKVLAEVEETNSTKTRNAGTDWRCRVWFTEYGQTVATALAAKDAELARLREFERQHDYCCCGDRIDAHNIGSGHAPVSVFDYEYGRAVERAERAEAQLAEANRKIAEKDRALEPEVQMTSRVEAVAEILWHRYSPDHEDSWPSPNADEYRRVASDILSTLSALEPAAH